MAIAVPRADREKSAWPGAVPHETSCCGYEAAGARADVRITLVPLRNTHLPTISAARFTDLNERVPFRDRSPSLMHRARSRKSPGEQRVNRVSPIASRGHGIPVVLVSDVVPVTPAA